jgi:hypothetical protein
MTATAGLITCPKCKAVLGGDYFNQTAAKPCPVCERRLWVEVFPALFRQDAARAPEQILAAGEAACFYHADKKAAVVCDNCGRLVCALCDLELNGQHLCPACLESGAAKGRLQQIQTRRTRHDKVALTLAVAPLLIFWLTIFTAPAAVFYSLWHWKSPGSLAPSRPRLIFSAAIIIGVLEILGWLALLIVVLTGD